ncbi:pimeloyl-ACP methyl ester carboxylesterase [Mycetocola sp. CAN_C7]|uniref:alpha/beta fold hydrolase n=1 Tax=Mycetocola sp. CAN_C7 TaxID=2787724 RepID=UPI0018C9DAFF
MPLLPESPAPRFVLARDNIRIATYEFGDPDGIPVVAVHGFASAGLLNWHLSGWTRVLTRAGFRVLAIDQRGHGASSKPHDPDAYTMPLLVDDLLDVLDTFMLDETFFVGYSLGARVGWQASIDLPGRITKAVLGGIPDGDPLTRFRVDEARACLETGNAPTDKLTAAYVKMASGIRGNDLAALISLVEGMRGGVQPDPANPPQQPVLFATGTEDAILEKSRTLAGAAPHGTFYEIPGRNHFNAPTSKDFREAALGFLSAGE